MKLNQVLIEKKCPEAEIFESVLALDNQTILELGCGDAATTRLIATTGIGRTVVATEVDTIQHEKNLLIDDLPNVDFVLCGSEKIPAEDNTFDSIFMFKSFHHVPIELMEQALDEVKRVLKPSGLVYISEPIFSGIFNEILRLFHDEEVVRQAAFDTIQKVIDKGHFSLVDEIFFNAPTHFDHFGQYEEMVIGATHSDHNLSEELSALVKQKFEYAYRSNSGDFIIPIRVDLLRNI